MILRKTMKHYQVPFKSYSTVKNVWKSVVGLEIHAQLNTKSKLFSGAQNTFGGLVNDCVSLFDASVPGTLPVLNRECVELGVKTALALSCKVNEVSTFDRKHYFYADLPSGYQITQQRAPLASDGVLSFQVYNPGIHKAPYKKSSRIKQIQLEQDSGKSLHDAELKRSLVDLNRAGAPLVELVFEPDLEDGEEAAALVKELVLIVQRLGACTARMEEGALRVDANVSVHKDGDVFGTRTEIKNINTIRGVANAIKYEIERQMSVVRDGGVVTNETRSWDSLNRVTVPMRDKETVQDYRYMPEPNLPPLRLNLRSKDETPDIISVPRIQETIPELPEDTRLRLIEKYNLKPESAIQIVNEPKLLEYFQNCNLSGVIDQQKIANLILNEVLYVLNKFKIDPINSPITVPQINDMVGLLANKKINLDVAKKVFSKIIEDDLVDLPSKIVNKNKWFVDTNRENITKICMDVLNNNPKMVKQYKSGKVKVFKALLGTLAKNSQGKIDMAVASSVMEELLKNMK